MSRATIAAITTALLLTAGRAWFDGHPWRFVVSCIGFVAALAVLHRVFAGTWHPDISRK